MHTLLTFPQGTPQEGCLEAIMVSHINIEHSWSVRSSPDRTDWVRALAGYTVLLKRFKTLTLFKCRVYLAL